MGQRNTESLDEIEDDDPWEGLPQEADRAGKANSENFTDDAGIDPLTGNFVNEKKVRIHYPRPVYLSQILPEISDWSGFNFVMDPALNRQMQVFAPRKIPQGDAFQIFVASLETVGLRALRIDSGLVKIVLNGFGERTA